MNTQRCGAPGFVMKLAAAAGFLLAAHCGVRGAEPAAPLPGGVRAVWDLAGASRETTPTRSGSASTASGAGSPPSRATKRPPSDGWGYFKVPGCWPGITDYMQKDSQTLYAHPTLEGRPAGRRHRGLVRARDHRPRRVDRPPHRAWPSST